MVETVLVPLLKIIVVLNATLLGVTYMVLLERKVIAWAQSRLGPMRVGPYGVLQPIADAVKLMLKEDITPARADKWVFTLAPILSMVPALIVYAVIPFGDEVHLFGRSVSLYITDINVGLLLFLAMSSLGVYAIVLAGWSSNNKYALLGGLRSSAQMISYELAMGLSVIPVVMFSGTLSLVGIVESQAGFYRPFANLPIALPNWGVFHWFLLLPFVIFLITMFAETNRTPFDLPEAEGELVAGFHTEYSSMKWAMFFLGEYMNMIVISSVCVTLFFGGWLGPGPAWLGLVWYLLKLLALLFLFIWVRWTFPRLRYDQLMNFGWKVLLPGAIANILIATVWLYGRWNG